MVQREGGYIIFIKDSQSTASAAIQLPTSIPGHVGAGRNLVGHGGTEDWKGSALPEMIQKRHCIANFTAIMVD